MKEQSQCNSTNVLLTTDHTAIITSHIDLPLIANCAMCTNVYRDKECTLETYSERRASLSVVSPLHRNFFSPVSIWQHHTLHAQLYSCSALIRGTAGALVRSADERTRQTHVYQNQKHLHRKIRGTSRVEWRPQMVSQSLLTESKFNQCNLMLALGRDEVHALITTMYKYIDWPIENWFQQAAIFLELTEIFLVHPSMYAL